MKLCVLQICTMIPSNFRIILLFGRPRQTLAATIQKICLEKKGISFQMDFPMILEQIHTF